MVMQKGGNNRSIDRRHRPIFLSFFFFLVNSLQCDTIRLHYSCLWSLGKLMMMMI